MGINAKITLLLIVLCASCFYAFTKERRSPTEHGQGSEGVSCPRTPMKFEEVKPVITVIGRNITLQCVTKFTLKFYDSLVWTKGDDDIFVVKNRKVQQNSDENRFRLAASIEGLGRGNASLNISHVKHTDNGSYSCCIKNTERQCINHTVVVKNESFTTKGPEKQQNTTPTTPSPQKKTNNGLVIGVPVAGGFICLIVLIVLLKRRGRRKIDRSGPDKPPELLLSGRRSSKEDV